MKLTENLVTFRLKLKNAPGTLGMAITTIGKLGGSMGNIQIIKADKEFKIRDLAVYVSTDKQVKDILSALSAIGKEFVDFFSRFFITFFQYFNYIFFIFLIRVKKPMRYFVLQSMFS